MKTKSQEEMNRTRLSALAIVGASSTGVRFAAHLGIRPATCQCIDHLLAWLLYLCFASQTRWADRWDQKLCHCMVSYQACLINPQMEARDFLHWSLTEVWDSSVGFCKMLCPLELEVLGHALTRLRSGLVDRNITVQARNEVLAHGPHN